MCAYDLSKIAGVSPDVEITFDQGERTPQHYVKKVAVSESNERDIRAVGRKSGQKREPTKESFDKARDDLKSCPDPQSEVKDVKKY
ncbi:MAG: hypothetical protein M1830_007727, partial [Pleopsidium flavum]